jgi:hypothetical protein
MTSLRARISKLLALTEMFALTARFTLAARFALTARIAVGAALVLAAACTAPPPPAARLAAEHGLRGEIVVGLAFRHVVYRNDRDASGRELHVYLDGDGTPYRRPDRVAADPGPDDPLMLRLMAHDAAPSVYLGRPCYDRVHGDANCTPAYWTLRRYSPEVVASLETVLRTEIGRSHAVRVVLFGHSGGGTLAVLLADRVPEVTRVVTLGANLDPDAWCKLHHYSPLAGSLNPTQSPPHREKLDVLHLVGADDRNTPPFLVRDAAHLRGEAVRVLPNVDHTCCWESLWPRVLDGTLSSDASL